MNLTDLMPYNNNSGGKHFHKSPQGLQKPITRSWRPQAIITLDLRPFSKADILSYTGMAHPGGSLTRVSNEKDSKIGCLKLLRRLSLAHKPVIRKVQKSKFILFYHDGKQKRNNILGLSVCWGGRGMVNILT